MMKVANEELMTPRDFRRALTPALKRLDDGEVEKLVLMQGGQFRYVILPVDRYEELEGADGGSGQGE